MKMTTTVNRAYDFLRRERYNENFRIPTDRLALLLRKFATEEMDYNLEIQTSRIDNRRVKCACSNSDCKIGLNFDRGDDYELMFLTDKYGNDNGMYLNVENIDETIARLQDAKERLLSKESIDDLNEEFLP